MQTPVGLDNFSRSIDPPTGRPLYYRHINGVEYFVRPVAGDLSVSPLTVLDGPAYARLADAKNGGVIVGEINHQEAPIESTGPAGEDLARRALGVEPTASTAADGGRCGPLIAPTTGPLVATDAVIWTAAIVAGAYLLGRLFGKARDGN